MMKRGKFFLFVWSVALLMAMLVGLLIWFGSHEWRPAEAMVLHTEIERTRPGTPAWSLMVDFRYEVDGTVFKKSNVDVFHNSDRAVTEAELREWPAGKRFTIYYSRSNPKWFSLSSDGGFEATAVVVILLIGGAAACLFPLLLFWRLKTKSPVK